MRRIITKELAQKIREKLCQGQTPKDVAGHDVYPVRYKNLVVAHVSVRRGSEKDKGHDHIPPALNISPHFAREIGICNKYFDDYIECLREKGLIAKESEPALPAPQAKYPWERDWVAEQEGEPPNGGSGESSI
jgi:hypothetical protein